jgi:hypothetical protein
MLTAMLHPEPYSKKVSATDTFSHQRLSHARKVLKYSRELAESVVRGDTSLDAFLFSVLF